MDLGSPQKTPSMLGGVISKKHAFLIVAGLVLVVGIGLRASHYFGEPAGEATAPAAVDATPLEGNASPEAVAAPESAKGPEVPALPPAAAPEAAALPEPAATPEPAAPSIIDTTSEPVPETPPAAREAATTPSEPADAAGQAEPSLPDAGMILVARKPVELLASPSPSATVMFGFPAGRPFRVIGEEAGFAHIRDLKSGTTGWIDKAALAPPPPLATSAPPRATPATGGGKPSTASSGPKPKATTNENSSCRRCRDARRAAQASRLVRWRWPLWRPFR